MVLTKQKLRVFNKYRGQVVRLVPVRWHIGVDVLLSMLLNYPHILTSFDWLVDGTVGLNCLTLGNKRVSDLDFCITPRNRDLTGVHLRPRSKVPEPLTATLALF